VGDRAFVPAAFLDKGEGSVVGFEVGDCLAHEPALLQDPDTRLKAPVQGGEGELPQDQVVRLPGAPTLPSLGAP
jgi:hypothetical protein